MYYCRKGGIITPTVDFLQSVGRVKLFLMKFAIHTFGCKVNSYESEYMAELFEKNGLERTFQDNADIHIINSCTVTGYGEKKVRKQISHLRRNDPDSVIILTGCMPQARVETQSSLDDLDADIIIGTRDRTKLFELFEEYMRTRQRLVLLEKYSGKQTFEQMKCQGFGARTRATVKIEDGCDNFCSYCIIPYARGRVRSKLLCDIESEVQSLAENGYKEIVLAGINLSAYGSDIGKNLCDAVMAAAKPQGVQRVRLSSLETERLGLDAVERLSQIEKLCPHFHISLQSGSDAVLKAMNRKYTADDYIALCDKFYELFENCAITTDVIVGFPNETDEDFAKTLAMIERIGFADVHVFPYSPRIGTKAAKMPQLPDYVKTERASLAEKCAADMRRKYLAKQVGKTLKVLFERENCTEFHQGYAENYRKVKIRAKSGEKSLQNKCFCVKIKEYDDSCLIGEISDEKIN